MSKKTEEKKEDKVIFKIRLKDFLGIIIIFLLVFIFGLFMYRIAYKNIVTTYGLDDSTSSSYQQNITE